MGNKVKKVTARAEQEPVTDDRVYWGLLSEGEKVPEALFSERRFAEAYFGVLSAEAREKTRIVRTYVTVWLLGDKGRIPRRSPRTKPS